MSKFSTAGYHAYRILHITFILIPIIAGVDKFFNFFTNWSQYLSPLAQDLLEDYSNIFMIAVGVIEIIAGIGVFFKPSFFAYVVFAWLLAISANLVLTGYYFDIALRDIGLALAAFALGNLSKEYAKEKINLSI